MDFEAIKTLKKNKRHRNREGKDDEADLILRQKVEGIGTASSKISVRWGMLKRLSKSFWNLDFQSGSLNSIAGQWFLTLAKTLVWEAVLLKFDLKRRELRLGNPLGRLEERCGRSTLGAIACERVPMKRRSRGNGLRERRMCVWIPGK